LAISDYRVTGTSRGNGKKRKEKRNVNRWRGKTYKFLNGNAIRGISLASYRRFFSSEFSPDGKIHWQMQKHIKI
jgi:hypothetical protein